MDDRPESRGQPGAPEGELVASQGDTSSIQCLSVNRLAPCHLTHPRTQGGPPGSTSFLSSMARSNRQCSVLVLGSRGETDGTASGSRAVPVHQSKSAASSIAQCYQIGSPFSSPVQTIAGRLGAQPLSLLQGVYPNMCRTIRMRSSVHTYSPGGHCSSSRNVPGLEDLSRRMLLSQIWFVPDAPPRVPASQGERRGCACSFIDDIPRHAPGTRTQRGLRFQQPLKPSTAQPAHTATASACPVGVKVVTTWRCHARPDWILLFPLQSLCGALAPATPSPALHPSLLIIDSASRWCMQPVDDDVCRQDLKMTGPDRMSDETGRGAPTTSDGATHLVRRG